MYLGPDGAMMRMLQASQFLLLVLRTGHPFRLAALDDWNVVLPLTRRDILEWNDSFCQAKLFLSADTGSGRLCAFKSVSPSTGLLPVS